MFAIVVRVVTDPWSRVSIVSLSLYLVESRILRDPPSLSGLRYRVTEFETKNRSRC